MSKPLLFLLLAALFTPASVFAKSHLIVIEGGYSTLHAPGSYDAPAQAVNQIRSEFAQARLKLAVIKPRERPNPLDKYLTGGFDLIIGVGIKVSETAYMAAANNKYQQYALIDVRHSNIKDNAMGFTFVYAEAGFLAGFIAAQTSQTGSVGFIGGELLPQLKDFARGFSDGAKYANPNIKVKSTYIGTFFNTYDAQNEADRMFMAGADVVCQLAGPGGRGVLEAAQNNKKWCLNIETTPNNLPEKNLLAAVVINYDLAIYEACRLMETNTFSGGGSRRFNIANGGIYPVLGQALDAAVQKATQQLLHDISSGKIPVRDYNSRIIN